MADSKLPVHAEADIPAKLAEHGLAGWYYEDGWIRRKYTTTGWQATLLLVNAVAFLAESAWHHPDLSVTWAKVHVKLRSHAEGGITDKDLALARRIEDVVLWRPPEGGPLTPPPKVLVKGGD
jgi:4a-hydroxytetrahydrobiopterin dehydratase